MPAAAGISIRRSSVRLRADPSRVISCLFVPGQEGFERAESRTDIVVNRLLALDEAEVDRLLDDVIRRIAARHRDLLGVFRLHADEVADRIDPHTTLSPSRRLLLGATFTNEFSVEGAALCNPSMVLHPDQRGVATGSVRFAMSVRAIGEGHRSSIGFRTGSVDAEGNVTVDATGPFATVGTVEPVVLEAAAFRGELRLHGADGESADYVLAPLGDRFTQADLDASLARLSEHRQTRRNADATIAIIRSVAARSYGVCFDDDVPLPEQVLWPVVEAERQGMEDARFVRFIDDDGTVTYFATYTAYDGSEISQQLLETSDFRRYTSTPIGGAAAANKGLGLFPRRIAGRFAAMSRSDRETNSVAFSDDPRSWDHAEVCQLPQESWELLQLGNCGPPIETPEGWLVLTHGVGPMRTYSIGALLLDLDDPTKVLGRLRTPLLAAGPDEQDGYVPNVVYSCGSMVHRDKLVIPFGIGDAAIGVATVPLPDLVGALVDAGA